MTWQPVEEWLREHHPEGITQLARPATEEALDALQRSLDMKLPEDFLAAWREHDGEVLNAPEYLFGNVLHLPVAAIVSERDTMIEALDALPDEATSSEVEGPVRPLYWSRRWVPFVLVSGASDYYCLDLDPPEGGRYGQVIRVSAKLSPRRVVAPDLATYLAELPARHGPHGLATREAPSPTTTHDEPDPTALRPKDYGWFAVRMVFVVLFWIAAYWAMKRTSAVSVSVAIAAWGVWYGVSRFANAKTRVP